jgi:hypothetical protein
VLAWCAAARTAVTLRSTSAWVVAQLLMLIRMARRPRQVVGPHQQVPSRCSAAIISRSRGRLHRRPRRKTQAEDLVPFRQPSTPSRDRPAAS